MVSKKLCKLEIVLTQMNSNSTIPFIKKYNSSDSNGKVVFKEKGTIAKEIIEWLLDNGFFKNPNQLIWLGLNYDLDRLGKSELMEAHVEDHPEGLNITYKRRTGNSNALEKSNLS